MRRSSSSSPMRCTRARPSSMLAGRSPSNRSGVWTVCPPLPSSAANARTPPVSPCTWWNSTTSAISALLALQLSAAFTGRVSDRVRRERHRYSFAAALTASAVPARPRSSVCGGHRFHVGGGLVGVDEELVDRGGVGEDLGELVGDLLELRGRAEHLLRV